MTTATPADRYPTGDPVAMTQVIGEPYETTDERGDPVGIAEHIVAVTGVVDEVGDVFVPGVFADAIRNGPKAKGVSGHDWGTKVSKALEREEWMPGDPRIAERIIPNLPEGKTWPREAGAVYVKAQYNLETPEGRRAYQNAKFFGSEESYSVGYKVARDGARKRGGRRYINKLDGWFEWSDVLHGANNLAFGLSVKGLLDSELEYSGGRLVNGEVKALRYVRDSTFWGLPVGTVIRPGMKPRGPKALKLRKAGEVPDPSAGLTAKKPTGTAADRKAPLAPKDKPDPGLFDEPKRDTVRATAKKPVDIEDYDPVAEFAMDMVDAKKFGTRTKLEDHQTEIDALLAEGITPDELGDLLRDAPQWGADGPDEDAIGRLTQAYSEEYRRRAREQRTPEPAELADGEEAAAPGTTADEDVAPDAGATQKPLSTPLATQIRDALAATSDDEPLGNRLIDAAPDGQAGIAVRGIVSSLNADAKRTGRSKNPRPQKRVDPARGAQRSIDHFKLTPEQAGERADAYEAVAEAVDDLSLDTPDPGDGFGKSTDYWRATAAAYRGKPPEDAGTLEGDPDTGSAQEPTADAAAERGHAHLESQAPTPLDRSPVAAELGQIVNDPDVRGVLASVLAAPDADTARQMGRDLARRDPQQAATVQAEAGSVAEFARRDKRGYPEISKGLDNLDAFEAGALETPPGRDSEVSASDDELTPMSGSWDGPPTLRPDAGSAKRTIPPPPEDAPEDSAADTTEDAAPDEVISAEDLAVGEEVATDALGLIEADDGELEVTAEVADRQDRVEALLEGGDNAVKALDDTQLPDVRRDVADELALQEEIARRDRESRRARTAATPAEGETPEQGPPVAEEAATAAAEGAEGEDAGPVAPKREKPKTRAGLAGAAEDYADALDADDETAAAAALTRLASSLRRSRSESGNAQTLRDLLAADEPPDPARLREVAAAMRDEARKRRNEQAKTRRLAKRLERERLRSLLGSIDAEMRTRGLSAPSENTAGDKAGATEDGGVISAEELAAGQAAAEPSGRPQRTGDVAQPSQDLGPDKPTPTAVGEPDLGVWSDLDAMPVTVRGAHYEASVDVDPDQPDQFIYQYKVTGPDGDIAGIGSGKEATVNDSRRSVVDGLIEAFNNPNAYGGVPGDERLPDVPDALNEEGADDGQDRGTRRGALEEVPAGGVLPDQGPGSVLPDAGDRGGAADRGAGRGAGAGAAAGGDRGAAGGLADQRPPGRGIGGAAGPGAAAGGVGLGERGGEPGGPGAEGGPEPVRGGEGGTGAPDRGQDESGRGDDAGLTDPGVTEKDQPLPDAAAVNRVPSTGDAFTPTGLESFAPPGERAKLNANMDALRTLRVLQSEDPPRPATADEQQTLARWAGWGGLPKVFDDSFPDYAAEREELRALLSPEEWNAAKRNTLNAHYTDPRAVSAIWQAVQDLGVTRGRVLEPGSGSGNFIGLAPEGMDMLGVELDPTTAAMSKYLYPDAEIRNESFARSRFPDGAFDAAVGNVPFGDFTLTDRQGNKGRHSIHNHFIIKSLKATRPGGIVAMLTSRYTMDSQDSKARTEMAELGDLLGAVRLPTGSHRAASGTDVIEDVLIFRRREDGSEPATDQGWIEAAKQTIPSSDDTGGYDLPINTYWAQHPDHVLGTMRAEKGRYGSGDLIVDTDAGRADNSLSDELATALRSITDEANANQLGATMRDGAAPELVDTTSASAGGRYEGNIGADTSSGDPATYKFTQVAGGEVIDVTDDIPMSARAEFADLLGLRATLGALLAAENDTATDTPRILALRAELNQRYDRYTDQYGAVTRYTVTKSGARQRPAAVRAFRRDPQSAIIRALESNYDPAGDGGKGAWSRASIFTKRSAAPRQIAATADNPKDALALSLESTGRIDLPAIGEMLGVTDPKQVRAALGDLVFEGPDLTPDQEDLIVRLERARALGVEPSADDTTAALDLGEQVAAVTAGPLQTASEYLSGDVRRKLAVARHMARHDPRYETNVAALESVLPVDLGPAEINARLGASWIPPDVVRDFVRDLHGIDNDRHNQVQVSQAGSVWTVIGPKYGNAATEEWGTDRRTASDLVQAMLEQRPIRITTKDPDGKSVQDLSATLAAQAKVEALAERFAEWAWEDPQRARRLADNYNWQFNGIALRNYDGAERTFPGMAAEFTPRPHQVAAVERIVNEPTALLAHVVGAGKTAEMVMGTAELKRLGLARKPAIVVPNHMLEQFTREYLEIYPNARVLAAGTDDLTGDKRRDFVARAATGDWDAVILTQKAFEAIPMSPEQQEAYIDRELADMRAALETAQASLGEAADEATKKTVKQMEKALIRAEEAMRKKLDKEKDSAVSFEQTGIDYLMVDEAHHYSNLRTLSNIPNAGAAGSDMATDLHMKIEYLREHTQTGRVATRVATFATGTPVRNTVTQTYIMQRYLRPDLLRDAGLTSFDSWAATFGQVVEEMELKPEGSGFRQTSRFAKFQNVPELLRMMHVFADVKLAEDLNLPTPNLVGGRTETVSVPASPGQDAYLPTLGERAEKVRSGGVKPDEDNMLKISGDGRKAALSMRLVGQEHEPGKIEAAADRISAIYADTKDRPYPVDPKHPEGGDAPPPGGLQIVFLDLGTPKAKGKGRGQSMDDNDTDWNGYEELRTQLADRGVPPEKVAFIHSARNDAEKAELFARARSGKISVLIGSTEKMGVGTNVQRRAVALHHLDAPWRPSDVEQRDGRIMRQGNLNPDVQVIRYVTEGSFDAYMWQTLERKAKFINQIMRGSLDVREIEDVGETALSYAEVKALATGNPDLMAKTKVDTLRGKLEQLFRTHTRTQTNNANMVGILTMGAEQADRNAEALDAAADRRVDTRGDTFRMEFARGYRDGFMDPVTKRDAAADGLRQVLGNYVQRGDNSYYNIPGPQVIGRIGGHTVVAHYERRTAGGWVTLRFDGVPGDIGSFTAHEVANTNLLPRIERALEGFEARADAERDRADSSRTEAERVRQRVGLEFPRMAELEAARAKADRLTAKMQRDALRDQYRKQGTDWDDPQTAASMDPEILARLRFDPQIDTDEFDSPLLEQDTTTDPAAGRFDSAAARARLRATPTTASEPAAATADEPVGDRPFRTVAELREHLTNTGAYGYGQGGNIAWDTALLSPGAGLFMFRTGDGRSAEWKIAHTGSGLVVARGLPGGRKGARDVMGALERVEAPNGQPIDWTAPDGDTLRQRIRDSGFTSGSALVDAARAAAAPDDVNGRAA